MVDNPGEYYSSDFTEEDFKSLSTVNGTRYEEALTVVDGKVALKEDSTELSDKEKEWAINEGYNIKEKYDPNDERWQIVKGSAKEYTNNGKAIIPIGFAIVPGLDDVSDGLVISDIAYDRNDKGNQYVWIPVEDFSTFSRKPWYVGSTSYSIYTTDYTEPYSYNGATPDPQEKAEYDSMIESVKEYKGFYVGRYEASNDGNDNAQTKKYKKPWTVIKWSSERDMTTQTGGCVEKARSVYPVASATKGNAVSHLLYGVEWDVATYFITSESINIMKDSSSYGAYSNVSFEYTDEVGEIQTKPETKFTVMHPIPTGSTDRNKLKNVYDMAGNAEEWTMEANQNTSRVPRGGKIEDKGNSRTIGWRRVDSYTYPTAYAYYLGFRIALYIK